MENDTFDWGQLPSDWWLQTAREIGADERQAKFAAAKFRNCSNSEAARLAGYGAGGAESTRSEGYRVSRSNKVTQLLALAAAEAGGGYDGSLTKQEARGILTAMARGSDPAIKIKAIELLAKMDREDEETRAASKGDSDTVEELAALIASILQDAVGALLAMCWWSENSGIAVFPFLKECGPRIAKTYPNQWKQWRDKESSGHWADSLDRVATAGEVLTDDALVAAVKGKLPRPLKVTVDG
jgi:hypothetical protein